MLGIYPKFTLGIQIITHKTTWIKANEWAAVVRELLARSEWGCKILFYSYVINAGILELTYFCLRGRGGKGKRE